MFALGQWMKHRFFSVPGVVSSTSTFLSASGAVFVKQRAVRRFANIQLWLVVSTPLNNISQWEGLSHIPVVPHKAVAEVSKIGNL